jgi:hypothetical protein
MAPVERLLSMMGVVVLPGCAERTEHARRSGFFAPGPLAVPSASAGVQTGALTPDAEVPTERDPAPQEETNAAALEKELDLLQQELDRPSGPGRS